MVIYDDSIQRAVDKNRLPFDIFKRFVNVFIALDATKDLDLFDITELKGYSIPYYRVRKGKYRAVFHFEENNDIYVHIIAKRKEVYKAWK